LPAGTDEVVAYLQWFRDNDWYRLDLVEGQELTLSITDLPFIRSVYVYHRGEEGSFYKFFKRGQPHSFVPPFTGTYTIGVLFRTVYTFQCYGSSATVPYVLRLEGLPRAPVVTAPVADALVCPAELTVSWDHSFGEGQEQAYYHVQIARDQAFSDLVLDSGETPGSEPECVLEVEKMGDFFLRVRVGSNAGTWSTWSQPVPFQAGLVRLIDPPEFYYATDLGPDSTATFAHELSTDCSITGWIAGRDGRAVSPVAPGTDFEGRPTLWWPGVVLDEDGQFPVKLAPRGRYTLVLQASCLSHPDLVQEVEWAFLVAW